MRKISVIIPALNEENEIFQAVRDIVEKTPPELLEEVIVVDGQSEDGTVERAKEAGAEVVMSEKARRSIQMNRGAVRAQGDVLYFLHADCRAPEGYAEAIVAAIGDGVHYGCFRRQVGENKEKKGLGFVSFVSRFRGPMFRGGDASLFVRKDTFDRAGMFKEELILMEDFEILPRLRRQGKFRLLPGYVLASDRKHIENHYSWRVLFGCMLVWAMYYVGFSQGRLLKTYRRYVIGAKYH